MKTFVVSAALLVPAVLFISTFGWLWFATMVGVFGAGLVVGLYLAFSQITEAIEKQGRRERDELGH